VVEGQWLALEIPSGRLYAGILDVDRDECVVQETLSSGRNRIDFVLAEERSIVIVVRQGADDTPVGLIYLDGMLFARPGLAEPERRPPKSRATTLLIFALVHRHACAVPAFSRVGPKLVHLCALLPITLARSIIVV
jgi:hypothetical protein